MEGEAWDGELWMRCGRNLPVRVSGAITLIAVHVSPLCVCCPAGTRLEYTEVLSIEYRRVRTADIMDSWAWQVLGSWIWRTLAVATPRGGLEH